MSEEYGKENKTENIINNGEKLEDTVTESEKKAEEVINQTGETAVGESITESVEETTDAEVSAPEVEETTDVEVDAPSAEENNETQSERIYNSDTSSEEYKKKKSFFTDLKLKHNGLFAKVKLATIGQKIISFIQKIISAVKTLFVRINASKYARWIYIGVGAIVVAWIAVCIFARPEVVEPAVVEPAVEVVEPDPVVEPIEVEDSFAPYVSAEMKDAYDKNNDVVGWLKLECCEINDPVVQGYDNDQYLRRTVFSSDYDVWGCYFLDYINIIDENTLFDRVTIIYGHSLDDFSESEKFSKLKRYKKASFLESNPTIEFSLLYEEHEFEIFAVTDMPITIDYINPRPDDSTYADTLNYLVKNSYVNCGVDVSTDDQILILSTCTSDENVRFVIAAKLVK